MGQEVQMDEYEGCVRPPLLHWLAKPLRGTWPRQGWCVPVCCVKKGVPSYKIRPCQSWFFLFFFTNTLLLCGADWWTSCMYNWRISTCWRAAARLNSDSFPVDFPAASDHFHDDWQNIFIRMLAIFDLLKLSNESPGSSTFFCFRKRTLWTVQ